MIVIRQAIKEAMRDKLISSNPAEFVVMPKMQRRNVDFYTEKYRLQAQQSVLSPGKMQENR